MDEMEDFFTRDKANEGVKMPLYKADNTLSDHSLTIRGIDSDEFRRVDADLKRRVVDIHALEDESEKQRQIKRANLELIAALVSGWSFKKECSKESVIEFLIKAPQIKDEIDRFAGKRSLFFAKWLSDSKNAPEKNSSSTTSRKARKSVSGKA